jgi:hypothetical protein
MELEQRVTRLEERTVAVERDIKEIKAQLNETAKKSDVERLENTLEQRDANYTRNLWKLIFILIAVFTAITLAAVGLSVADISLPTMLGGADGPVSRMWSCFVCAWPLLGVSPLRRERLRISRIGGGAEC